MESMLKQLHSRCTNANSRFPRCALHHRSRTRNSNLMKDWIVRHAIECQQENVTRSITMWTAQMLITKRLISTQPVNWLTEQSNVLSRVFCSEVCVGPHPIVSKTMDKFYSRETLYNNGQTATTWKLLLHGHEWQRDVINMWRKSATARQWATT
jgi:hypothetical protein